MAIKDELKRVEMQGNFGVYYDSEGMPDIEYNSALGRDTWIGNYWDVGIIEKMRNDAKVASVLNLIRLGVMNATPTIQPASDSPDDLRIKKFVEHCLFNAQDHHNKLYHDLLILIYGFIPYSYGNLFIEKVPDVGNDFMCLEFFERKPSTIEEIERDKATGRIEWMEQEVEGERLRLTPDRTNVVTYNEEFGNITGYPLMRHMYQSYYNKQKAMIICLMNLERLGGIPKIEGVSNTKDKSYLRKTLKNIRVHEQGYVVLDQDQGKFDILKAGGEIEDHIKLLNYFDNQIAMVGLTQFMSLGTDGNSGNRSLGQTLSDAFYQSLHSLVTQIEKPYNVGSRSFEPYIKKLVDLNFPNVTEYPKYKIERLQSTNVELLKQSYETLQMASNMSPHDEEIVRKKLELINDEVQERLDKTKKDFKEVRKKAEKDDKTIEVIENNEGDNCGCGCGNSGTHHFANVFPMPLKLSRQRRATEESVNLLEYNKRFNGFGSTIRRQLSDAFFDMIEPKLSQLSKDVKAKEAPKVRKFRITKNDREKVIAKALDQVKLAYAYGANSVNQELDLQKQKQKLFQDEIDLDKILQPLANSVDKDIVEMSTDEFFNSIEAQAIRDGLAQVRNQDPRPEVIEAGITQTAERNFDDLAFFYVNAAINKGREDQAIIRKEEIRVVEYSAILDSNVCPDCVRKDGAQFAIESDEAEQFRVPNPFCFSTRRANGANRCRCIWVFILKTEV